MNIVTSGSRSVLSKTFNHVLYQCKLTKNMFYRTNADVTCRQSIINNFSADDEIVYRGMFAQMHRLWEGEPPVVINSGTWR